MNSTKLLSSSISAFAFTLFSCQLALAAAPSKPFEAVIESYSTGAPIKTHIWNDGKGHQRSETAVSGRNSVSISDFSNKMIYAIDDQRRTITTMSMNPTNSDQPDPSVKWTAIGAKVIDGHPCQGKRGTVSGAQVEFWEGTDIGYNVVVVTNGKTTQKLLSWKPLTPNPSMFSLPAGYQKIDMNALMRGFSAGGAGPQKFDPASVQKMYQKQSASGED
jgi:hypothetical protein